MQIKPNKPIEAVDRKQNNKNVKKKDDKSEDLSFHNILDEIDVIHISSMDNNGNLDEKEKNKNENERDLNNKSKNKLDKFA